jgi:hypothetical protein
VKGLSEAKADKMVEAAKKLTTAGSWMTGNEAMQKVFTVGQLLQELHGMALGEGQAGGPPAVARRVHGACHWMRLQVACIVQCAAEVIMHLTTLGGLNLPVSPLSNLPVSPLISHVLMAACHTQWCTGSERVRWSR